MQFVHGFYSGNENEASK